MEKIVAIVAAVVIVVVAFVFVNLRRGELEASFKTRTDCVVTKALTGC